MTKNSASSSFKKISFQMRIEAGDYFDLKNLIGRRRGKKMSKNLKTTRNPSFPEDSEGVIRREKRLNKKFDGFRIDFDVSKTFCGLVILLVCRSGSRWPVL